MKTAYEFAQTLKAFRNTAKACAHRLAHAGYTRQDAEAAMVALFPRGGRKAVALAYYEQSL